MIERRCIFFVVISGKTRRIEPHLMPEDAQRAGPGAIGLRAVVEDR
jgi:hypothetical protein